MTSDIKETVSPPKEFGIPRVCLQLVGSRLSCSRLGWPGLQRGCGGIGRPTRGRPCFVSPAPPHRGPPGQSSTAAPSVAFWVLVHLTQHVYSCTVYWKHTQTQLSAANIKATPTASFSCQGCGQLIAQLPVMNNTPHSLTLSLRVSGANPLSHGGE